MNVQIYITDPDEYVVRVDRQPIGRQTERVADVRPERSPSVTRDSRREPKRPFPTATLGVLFASLLALGGPADVAALETVDCDPVVATITEADANRFADAFFAGYASILVLAGTTSILRSPIAVMVFNLPALLILLAVALGIAAVSAWKGRASLASRIHLTLLSPAALALAWFAWQWNALGYMG
jgi:hypothetical protein